MTQDLELFQVPGHAQSSPVRPVEVGQDVGRMRRRSTCSVIATSEPIGKKSWNIESALVTEKL